MLFLNTNLIYEMGYQIEITDDKVVCSKFGFETEYFEIKHDSNRYFVSVPLKNSVYQYRTSFLYYDQALEYFESMLRDYCNCNC